MTVREIVDQVIDDLKKVQAPVELFDQVIVPIKRSINGLEMIVHAWDEQEAQAAQEPEPVNEEEQANG